MRAAFIDRDDAGHQIAARAVEREWVRPVVFGIARGGVPVAAHVARALRAPLGVAVARKVAAPGHPELGVGAVTADGPPVFDERGMAMLGLRPADLTAAVERQRAEARRRTSLYRQAAQPPPVEGRDVLVVDDGLATGVTARAALGGLRTQRPRKLVFAAPVCAHDSVHALTDDCDEVLCVATIVDFGAVAHWYHDFRQTTDDEVNATLSGVDVQLG
jgi:predicted phosphoribosyltransferase